MAEGGSKSWSLRETCGDLWAVVPTVNKRKILVFAHVPPPHHGQSVMVQVLLDVGWTAGGSVVGGLSCQCSGSRGAEFQVSCSCRGQNRVHCCANRNDGFGAGRAGWSGRWRVWI